MSQLQLRDRFFEIDLVSHSLGQLRFPGTARFQLLDNHKPVAGLTHSLPIKRFSHNSQSSPGAKLQLYCKAGLSFKRPFETE